VNITGIFEHSGGFGCALAVEPDNNTQHWVLDSLCVIVWAPFYQYYEFKFHFKLDFDFQLFSFLADCLANLLSQFIFRILIYKQFSNFILSGLRKVLWFSDWFEEVRYSGVRTRLIIWRSRQLPSQTVTHLTFLFLHSLIHYFAVTESFNLTFEERISVCSLTYFN